MEEEVLPSLPQNFFQCIGSLLGTEPIRVHSDTVLHFARIVFTNWDEINHHHHHHSLESILNDQKILAQLQVCRASALNPAVRAWIKRVHNGQPTMHQTPEDWIRVYPKVFKGAALRFLYYHRSYERKPGRLFCRVTFAHLVSEVYCCRVSIEAGENWIYPTSSNKYFWDMDLISIALEYCNETKLFLQCDTTKTQSLLVAAAAVVPPLRFTKNTDTWTDSV
jgi:hypothetical protein